MEDMIALSHQWRRFSFTQVETLQQQVSPLRSLSLRSGRDDKIFG
jgi:hypothetical protein